MITFVTCWYRLKAKFPKDTYKQWIHNFLSNVNNFNLVIFTDQSSSMDLENYSTNNKIVIIIKPVDKFYGIKYKEFWIQNHKINHTLNSNSRWDTDWQLNMLWSEKINLVKEVVNKNLFDSSWFGWCDIGYFRTRHLIDIPFDSIANWPKRDAEDNLKINKIYYNVVGSNEQMKDAMTRVMNSNNKHLPNPPFSSNQITISGGFFLIHNDLIDWWWSTYYERLELYFENKYLVKDDQIIITDCLMRNMDKFCLIKSKIGDPWFAFSHFLL